MRQRSPHVRGAYVRLGLHPLRPADASGRRQVLDVRERPGDRAVRAGRRT